jgi:hypothetical protein
MARHSRDWNEGLRQDLRDSKFAVGFLVAAIYEDIAVDSIVRKIALAVADSVTQRESVPNTNDEAPDN